MPTAHPLGRKYEDMAAGYLQSKGFTILMRNYRYQKAEIDIIVQKGGCLHFVEVKARSSLSFGYPETFVSTGQEERIKQGAESYMQEQDWQQAICFGIVAITQRRKGIEIVHFEDVFI
jgi:putative endonuclease